MAEAKRPSGLGRGLSALLGDLQASVPATATAPAQAAPAEPAGVVQPASATLAVVSGGVTRLPIEKIIANPRQPRRHFAEEALNDLAASIREQGVLQPLLVRPAPGKPGLYEIVAGERRWRASQRVPLHELPVLVRELDEATTLEIALIENIQRQDLNPIEEADGYRRLMDEFGHTQEEVGRLVSKSRSHVANLLRLLDLPPYVRALVAEGALSMGHARAIAATPDPAGLADKVVEEGLSVRQAELLAQAAKQTVSTTRAPKLKPGKDADTVALERDLAAALGMKVEIADQGGKGVLTVRYASFDQLDELCGRLTSRGL